jgi:hypothetical protein
VHPFLVSVFTRLMRDDEARVQRLDVLGAAPDTTGTTMGT